MWYEFHLPSAGTLDLAVAYRDDTDDQFDFDWSVLDASLQLISFDPADGRLIERLQCADTAGAGGGEQIKRHLAAGSYRVMVAGALATDAPSSASDGLFLLGGTFTPDPPPPPPPPPDSDGDGIVDPNDGCPTVKAAPPDADRNGCTDAVVIRDARRLTSDFKYEWGKWRRNGRLHGAILRKVRIADASAGSKVTVTCSGCSILRGGKVRRFKRYSTTMRRNGVVKTPQVENLLIPRGKKAVVVITRSGFTGRRVELKMGGRRPAYKLSCLAAGSTTSRIACVSGG